MADDSLTEARAALPQLLNRAAEGEEITIGSHGAPAVRLASQHRWMRTKTHDVLFEAREPRGLRKAAWFEDFVPADGGDADAHVAMLPRYYSGSMIT